MTDIEQERVEIDFTNHHNAAKCVEADALSSLQDHLTRLEAEKGELVEALRTLEGANEAVCATRSRETYLRMIDVDGASDDLLALDFARSAARALISKHSGERATLNQTTGDGK